MQLKNFLHMTHYKVCANLRSEVSRYYMNYLWWIFEPVLSMAVYYVMFGIVLKRGTPDFGAFLLIGICVWQWFIRAITHSTTSILQAKNLLTQLKITKGFFPVVIIFQDTAKHLFAFSMLLLFLPIYGLPPTAAWLSLPILFAVQLILTFGCGLLAAAVVPFFPDLKFIIATGLQLMFFATGIFFDIDKFILPKHQTLLYMNPMAGLIKNYRAVLLHGTWPDWTYIGAVCLFSLLLLAASTALIRRFDHLYPRVCQ